MLCVVLGVFVFAELSFSCGTCISTAGIVFCLLTFLGLSCPFISKPNSPSVLLLVPLLWDLLSL